MDIVLVTGRFTLADGTTPAKGTVTFTLSSPLKDAAGNVIATTKEITKPLIDGVLSVSLVATNSPGLDPSGVTYLVHERFVPNGHRTYSIVVPYDSEGGTLDLADVAPVQDSTITYGVTLQAFDAHTALTTGVHGIADTSALETTTGAQAKATAAQNAATTAAATDATTKADTAAADAIAAAATDATAKVDAHATDTTSVHGIADTSALVVNSQTVTDGESEVILARQPSGAGRGPFQWVIGGATFDSTYDPVLYFGYNAKSGGTQVVAGEPLLSWNIEVDYEFPTGTHLMEAYLEYWSADLSAHVRPFFTQINRGTQDVTVHLEANGTNGFVGFNIGDTQIAKFTATGVIFPAAAAGKLTINGSGAKDILSAQNNAGDSTIRLLSTDTSDQLLLGGVTGGSVMSRTVVATALEWRGPTGGGWQDVGLMHAGANADGSGMVFRLGVPSLSWGGKLYAGRWSSSDRGTRFVSVNSAGAEKSYLHLNGEGDSFTLATSAATRIQGNATGIAFFGATPVAKPSVSGSRGGNVALASLLTALTSLGLITDGSVA